ncbi:MAG TPA: glycosyltransferase family 2 protein [Hyphomicrobiaceae bacterium]|nr:glycosyltransferase family 2 protein [Hyphomicrobiaceae bacterium]
MTYWDAVAPSIALAALAIGLLPWFDREYAPARIIAIALCIALSWRYMHWRILATIPPADAQLDFFVGILFATIETLGVAGTSISLLFLTRIRNRSRDADENVPWLLGEAGAPRIDVLICTYNEERSILERTVLGAISLNYPNYRVWVCDDGRREWLREMCALYGVGYLTRPDNDHAKAGNINAALRHLDSLDEKPVFISILDADFVPFPDFLTRAASLMRDPEVGVVQTPQHFFNADPIQSNLSLTRVFPDEQRFFFDVIMASKDAWGAALCCGTSSVLRVSALRSIGGFPTDSVTEDYLVSLRLRQTGFKTVYLNEVLSLGLAPEGMAEYVGQRSRWCLGFMQICTGSSSPLRPGNGLPLVDRVMLSETFLHWWASHAFRLLGIVVPALFLLCGVQAVYARTEDAISHLLPVFVVHAATFIWLTQGRVLPIMADLYQLLCATDVLKATAAGLFRPRKQKFRVTAKGGDRSRVFVQWRMLATFLFYLGLTLAGIAASFLVDPTRPVPEASVLALSWSWYNVIVILLACYVCVEQAQRRNGDRFRTNEIVQLEADGKALHLRAGDISVSGIRLIGEMPGPIGMCVRVRIGEAILESTIVRTTPDGFALQFVPSQQARVAVTRHLFSGRYSAGVEQIQPGQVARAIGQRIFR